MLRDFPFCLRDCTWTCPRYLTDTETLHGVFICSHYYFTYVEHDYTSRLHLAARGYNTSCIFIVFENGQTGSTELMIGKIVKEVPTEENIKAGHLSSSFSLAFMCFGWTSVRTNLMLAGVVVAEAAQRRPNPDILIVCACIFPIGV